MKGLEYMLKITGISYTELAKDLGIARQNINYWLMKSGKIAKTQLPILSAKFNISEKALQRDVDNEVVNKVGRLLLTDDKGLFELLTKAIELRGADAVQNKLKELI